MFHKNSFLNAWNEPLLRKNLIFVLVDTTSPDLAARHLSVQCTKLNCTLLVGFGQAECAQYIVNFKRLEHKSVDWLRPKTDESNRVAKVLGAARGVNTTDAATLMAKFGTLGALSSAKKSDIVKCQGLGGAKAERLVELFNAPFKQ